MTLPDELIIPLWFVCAGLRCGSSDRTLTHPIEQVLETMNGLDKLRILNWASQVDQVRGAGACCFFDRHRRYKRPTHRTRKHQCRGFRGDVDDGDERGVGIRGRGRSLASVSQFAGFRSDGKTLAHRVPLRRAEVSLVPPDFRPNRSLQRHSETRCRIYRSREAFSALLLSRR